MTGLGIHLSSIDKSWQACDLLIFLEAVLPVKMFLLDQAVWLCLKFHMRIFSPKVSPLVVEDHLIVEFQAVTAATHDNEYENIEAKEGSNCDEYGVVEEGSIGSDNDGFFLERLSQGW